MTSRGKTVLPAPPTRMSRPHSGVRQDLWARDSAPSNPWARSPCRLWSPRRGPQLIVEISDLKQGVDASGHHVPKPTGQIKGQRQADRFLTLGGGAFPSITKGEMEREGCTKTENVRAVKGSISSN